MKRSTYRILLAAIAVFILILAVMLFFMQPSKPKRHNPNIDSTTVQTPTKPVFREDGKLSFMDAKTNAVISSIAIEIADDDAEREQGLMYRDAMQADQGMLFLMPTEEIQSFWMKNTIIPLDIIFVDAQRRIVDIHAKCKPYSLENRTSSKPALYVVEVNGGYAAQHKLKSGDLISF